MSYYHNLITDKSWQLLKELRKEYNFILIGGWAVFLYTKALKSKDIDLVIEPGELARLKENFAVTKNDRLKKYQAQKEEVEIDIYLPFYSNPGIPAEELTKLALVLEGFKVVKKEILAVLKSVALKQRTGSIKGRKDLIDLLSLFSLADFGWELFQKAVVKYGLESEAALVKQIIGSTTQMAELNLNVHRMAAVKRKIFSGWTRING